MIKKILFLILFSGSIPTFSFLNREITKKEKMIGVAVISSVFAAYLIYYLLSGKDRELEKLLKEVAGKDGIKSSLQFINNNKDKKLDVWCDKFFCILSCLRTMDLLEPVKQGNSTQGDIKKITDEICKYIPKLTLEDQIDLILKAITIQRADFVIYFMFYYYQDLFCSEDVDGNGNTLFHLIFKEKIKFMNNKWPSVIFEKIKNMKKLSIIDHKNKQGETPLFYITQHVGEYDGVLDFVPIFLSYNCNPFVKNNAEKSTCAFDLIFQKNDKRLQVDLLWYFLKFPDYREIPQYSPNSKKCIEFSEKIIDKNFTDFATEEKETISLHYDAIKNLYDYYLDLLDKNRGHDWNTFREPYIKSYWIYACSGFNLEKIEEVEFFEGIFQPDPDEQELNKKTIKFSSTI